MNPPETDQDIFASLDLALRVGEMLLSNGAGSADVAATMLAVTHACGLRGVTPNVTFTELSVNYHPGGERFSILQSRSVTHREIDYADLTDVDELVRDLMEGRTDLAGARRRVAQIASTGHARPRWAVTVGFGLMGAGTALLVSGVPLVVALAFVAAAGIDRIQRVMTVRRYPHFYQQVAGGLFAGLLGVAVAAVDLPVAPGRVITAAIFLLLAGIGAVGAAQDALNGFPVTANARILEAMLATMGLIAGISGGLALGAALGVELNSLRPGAVSTAEPAAMLLGAALTSGAFAYASYSPARALAPTAAMGALGAGVAMLVSATDLGTTWATAVAAVTIGAASYAASMLVRVPSLALLVPATVPLLPGLSLYRGLIDISEGGGGASMAAAAATAIALASGAILGQYIAQPLGRTSRRLETRLAGPRLVGPIRLASEPMRRAAARTRRLTRSGPTHPSS